MTMNRVLNLLGRAIIRQISDTLNRQTMQIEATKGELIDGVPRMQNYGITSVPPLNGTDCLVGYIGGVRDQGVVIIAENITYRVKGLKNGEVALYDMRGNVIKLGQEMIEVTATDRARLVCGASTVDIQPDGIDIESPRLTHNGVNIGSTHAHAGVESGDDISGAPIP